MSGLEGYFDMGGYGGFVWPAYGLAVLAFVILALASRRTACSRAGLLKKLQEQSPHRQRRAKAKKDEEAPDGL